MSYLASIVINTRNRRDALRKAVHSAIQQSVLSEVIVIDDGSTDGTAEMIRREFPQVLMMHHHHSKGCIVRRNEAARIASSDVIFSIDDDAELSSPYVVEQTLADFTSSEIGAVAIPFININSDGVLRQKSPNPDPHVTNTYIGTAHAIRRNIFLELGGYRDFFFHQGEESDLCIRMLQRGHFVRLGNSDPVLHYESPQRDLARMDFYGCRNAVLFAWLNTPAPVLPLHMAVTTLKCASWSLNPLRLRNRLSGLLTGFCDCITYPRSPVSLRTYRQFRKLSKGPLKLSNRTNPRRCQGIVRAGMKSLVKRLLLPRRRSLRRIRGGLISGMRMELNLQSQSQRLLGLDERELVAPMRYLIPRCKSLVDVGANDGYYTLAFLQSQALRVVACEPGRSVERLMRNAAANNFHQDERFIIRNCAVGRREGMIGIGDILRDLPVPVLVKMDIEGAEVDALQTVTATTDLSNVYWIIETHSRELEENCVHWLNEHNYDIRIVKNAFWRLVVPERRSPENRWIVATPWRN